MNDFSFTIRVTGKLDDVPGAYHNESTFQEIALRAIEGGNYDVKAEVVQTTDQREVFGGWLGMRDGWVEVNGFDRPIELGDDTLIQIKTAVMTGGHAEWVTPGQAWVPGRQELDRITHYRTKRTAAEKVGFAEAVEMVCSMADELVETWDAEQVDPRELEAIRIVRHSFNEKVDVMALQDDAAGRFFKHNAALIVESLGQRFDNDGDAMDRSLITLAMMTYALRGHRMNAVHQVVTTSGIVAHTGEDLGNWRWTMEKLDENGVPFPINEDPAAAHRVTIDRPMQRRTPTTDQSGNA